MVAIENVAQNEFGQDADFNNVVSGQKAVLYQIRAVDGQDYKLQFWYTFDLPRDGAFEIHCQTLYDVKIKKRCEKKIKRRHLVKYSEFN